MTLKLLRRLLLFIRLTVLALLLFAAGAFWLVLDHPRASGVLMAVLGELTHDAVRCESAIGPLKGPIEVRGFVYEDAHTRVDVAHARVDWNWLALLSGTLLIRDLDSGPALLTLKHPPAQPGQAGAGTATRLPLALVVRTAAIESFGIVTAPGAQPVSFEDIHLGADWTGDTISIESLHTRYAPVGVLDLAGELLLQPHAIALRKIIVNGLGELHVDGLIGYQDDGVQAELDWKDLRWPQSGETLVHSRKGAAQLKGTWNDFAYRLHGDLNAPPLSAVAEAQGRGSIHGLDFAPLKLQALGGSTLASGSLRWLPQLAASGRGSFSGINPQTLAADWPGALNGNFDGEYSPQRSQLQLALRDSQLRGYALQLRAHASREGAQLALQDLKLQSGGSELQASGRLRPVLDANLQLRSPDLGGLWPGLGGSADATLHLAGSYELPQIDSDVHVQQLRYQKLAVADVQLQTRLAPRGASTFRLELKDALAGVKIPLATLVGSGDVGHNRFDLHTHTAIGDIDMRFEGALDLRARQWNGRLVSGRGEPLRLSAWTLQEPASLNLSAALLELEPACWKSADSRACVQFHRNNAGARVAYRLEQLALAYFEPLFPPGWKLSGEVSGTGLLAQEGTHLRAQTDLQSSAGKLHIGEHEVLSYGASQLLAEETESGFVSRMQLPLANGGLYWDALLSPAPPPARDWTQRRWSGELRADLENLEPLRLLSPELESINGELHGKFTISGIAGAPRLGGEVALSKGRLRLATPGIELSAVEAHLTADSEGGAIGFDARASSGGGELQLKGQTDYASLGEAVTLKLSGDKFLAAATTQARIWISPKLSFSLLKGRADLTGEIVVPKAEITPTSFDQGVAPSGDQVIVGDEGAQKDGGLLKIYSAVRLSLGDDVKFDGFGLKTQLTGALDAADEPGRPTTARGEVRLQGGRYKAYGQDLSIETGRLIFNGGPITNPAVEIRAQRQPSEDVTVGLYVRGLLAAPEFSLFSTPAMPQEQQLAWLVLGRSLEETSTGGAAAAAGAERSAVSSAALSLGLSTGNVLTQKLQGGLRLDEISIASRPGETSDQAKLTLGKYLSPKLFISYGIGLFQPGQAFRLLYDIGHGFKLSTESGVESGGDLVYSIEK